jgi:hypothetical protein
MDSEPVNETIRYSFYRKTKVECVRWIATVDEDQRIFSTSICEVLDVHDVISLAYKSACTVLMRKRPNGLAFSCRERAAQDDFKKGPISRAKRSTATPCWAHMSGLKQYDAI